MYVSYVLSIKPNFLPLRYVSHFKKEKETLSQKLFKLYNESVFDKKVSLYLLKFTQT